MILGWLALQTSLTVFYTSTNANICSQAAKITLTVKLENVRNTGLYIVMLHAQMFCSFISILITGKLMIRSKNNTFVQITTQWHS